MTIDVVIYPKNESSIRWIGLNVLELKRVFMELHSRPDPALPNHRPHGFQLYLPDAPDRSIPPLYVIADAHRSQVHGDRTISDLREALRRLDAKLDDFDVGRTSD